MLVALIAGGVIEYWDRKEITYVDWIELEDIASKSCTGPSILAGHKSTDGTLPTFKAARHIERELKDAVKTHPLRTCQKKKAKTPARPKT